MKKYFFIVMIVWMGCRDNADECVIAPDVSNISMTVNYEALSDSITNAPSQEALEDFLKRHPKIMRNFLKGDITDSTFLNYWYTLFNNPSIHELLLDTHKVFGNEEELKSQFEEAFRNLKFYYPEFNAPRIQTVICGLETDMVVKDSTIMIGLDSYLGASAKYRPQVYEYQLSQYTPESIVPSVMLIYGISPATNSINPEDKTVLSDMITYGKAFYFAKHMLPCVADSTLIGYTAPEMKQVRANEDIIWKTLIDNEALYSTEKTDKQHYLEPRPKTYEVGDQCPGRIAQWVGWQIIRAFMDEHKNVSLQELMQMSDAQKLFRDSHYRPG